MQADMKISSPHIHFSLCYDGMRKRKPLWKTIETTLSCAAYGLNFLEMVWNALILAILKPCFEDEVESHHMFV
jgi:hypothetical protein